MGRLAAPALIKALLAVLILDQVTKFAVIHALNLPSVGQVDVLPPYLNFRMAWNQGVNFGLMGSSSGLMRWALIVIALVISGWVLLWVSKDPANTKAQLSAGVLIGGALGNVIDRLIYGAVADFLNMSCCGFENPYAFNVADIAIFAGAAGLILWADRAKTR